MTVVYVFEMFNLSGDEIIEDKWLGRAYQSAIKIWRDTSYLLYIAMENINLYVCRAYLSRIRRSFFIRLLSITKPQRNIAKQN